MRAIFVGNEQLQSHKGTENFIKLKKFTSRYSFYLIFFVSVFHAHLILVKAPLVENWSVLKLASLCDREVFFDENKFHK